VTMPHLMNCDHSDEWCLVCVKKMHAELEEVSIKLGEYRETLAWVKLKLSAGDTLGAALAIDRQLSAKGGA